MSEFRKAPETASDRTSELDQAVRAFTAENLQRQGVVTGWVLHVASSRFDEDGDMCHAYDYSVGPDCDLIRAVGLVELARSQMRRHLAAGDGTQRE